MTSLIAGVGLCRRRQRKRYSLPDHGRGPQRRTVFRPVRRVNVSLASSLRARTIYEVGQSTGLFDFLGVDVTGLGVASGFINARLNLGRRPPVDPEHSHTQSLVGDPRRVDGKVARQLVSERLTDAQLTAIR